MENRKRVRTESGRRRIRTYLGGEIVADTVAPLLVWEKPYYPVYYFPVAAVRAELTPTGETKRSPSRGEATLYTVSTSGAKAVGAAYRHLDSPVEELRDYVAFDWDAMRAWFEEDEEVFIHPRDPYRRVDALPSSRHVVVRVDGVVVADSRRPTILFETGLRPRYYLPPDDVRVDLLTPTDSRTGCPYKGFARYWSLTVDGTEHTDLVWAYDDPFPESAPVKGLMCFYDERVDLEVD